MNEQTKKRGRPRIAAKPLSNAERTRRRRARLRADGTTTHTINLSPEVAQGLEEWAKLMERQKSPDDMIGVSALFATDKLLLEPGKRELLKAFSDPKAKPLDRFVALVSAIGVQAMQNAINQEIGAQGQQTSRRRR